MKNTKCKNCLCYSTKRSRDGICLFPKKFGFCRYPNITRKAISPDDNCEYFFPRDIRK